MSKKIMCEEHASVNTRVQFFTEICLSEEKVKFYSSHSPVRSHKHIICDVPPQTLYGLFNLSTPFPSG